MMWPERRWLQTFTGKRLDPFDRTTWDFDVRDVAHALSLIPRYGGATERPYSVAEHCVRVSRLAADMAADQGFTRDGLDWVRRWGLVHDWPEGVLGFDVPRPVKLHPGFAFLRAQEDAILCAIAVWLRLPGPMPDVVDAADKAMPQVEGRDLFRGGPATDPATGRPWTDGYVAVPPRRIYAPLSAAEAERGLLDEFFRLWPERDRREAREAA